MDLCKIVANAYFYTAVTAGYIGQVYKSPGLINSHLTDFCVPAYTSFMAMDKSRTTAQRFLGFLVPPSAMTAYELSTDRLNSMIDAITQVLPFLNPPPLVYDEKDIWAYWIGSAATAALLNDNLRSKAFTLLQSKKAA